MECEVDEPWNRRGELGLIFPDCQEGATTTGMLQPQKLSLAGNPFHKPQKSKQPIKQTECCKGKKGNADNRSARKCEM